MLPKDAARYIVNSVVLRLTDLEDENAKLRYKLRQLQCACCHGFPTTDRHFRAECEICNRYICTDCQGNNTHDGRITCENHIDACGVCLAEYIEPNYQKCTICHIRICGDCINDNKHKTEDCVCGKPIFDCRQENYYHGDYTLRQGTCRTCNSDLCAHNQIHNCSFCERRCENCHNAYPEGEYCGELEDCENRFHALR